ncbi:MAG: aminopeptidase P family protein [Defluviitaleaceae bacterium]|nr:aminopeptidase P family protein [Defluviitaleaceae bacterium]
MHSLGNLAGLRELMREKNLDAYVIPSGDAHANGYVADYWRGREWFSGFTGSAGTVVVTAEKAGLWTDGRYFIQAAKQLTGTGIDLYKSGQPNVQEYTKFLADNLPQNANLGFDGRVVTAGEFSKIKDALNEKSVVYSYQDDLIGQLWKNRPSFPVEPAFEHAPEFAGALASEKLKSVRAKMKEKNITAYLVPSLDDIAWLLNIRGRDIPNLPVVYAYALITDAEAHIFIDPAKISGLSAKLAAQGFSFHAYDALPKFLITLSTLNLYYNPAKTNTLLAKAIPKNIKIAKGDDILPAIKSVKSEAELANIKNAFVKEGVALVKTLKWLDECVADSRPLVEGDVVRALQKFRREQAHYLCDAFPTISAYGENAAQAHYNSGETGAAIKPEGFLLIDTGGQYLDGTTDTTRTIALSEPTDEMKRDYTLVLKGHIALSRVIFPTGTLGSALDAIARVPLWEIGQNYNHGTGHGLGYCLSVHEGPQNISPRPNSVALLPGMLLSNEPALYKESRYGIRTENILLVTENQKTAFLSFENLTHCPIDTKAIDSALLAETEREWINAYHRRTFETLSPYLDTGEKAWLEKATLPL